MNSLSRFLTAMLLLVFCLMPSLMRAQGVAINITGAVADTSAMLDVSSTTKGVLVPRMLSTQRTAIFQPATGLIVFQTDAPSGFYYNAGTSTTPNWVLLIAGATAGTPNDVPNAIVQRDGAGGFAAGTITADSNIVLASTTTSTRGQIRQGSAPLMHSFGSNNFFAGPNAGNFTLTGSFNTGVGALTLGATTTGGSNTAVGFKALQANTTGQMNTAIGNQALNFNNTGSSNTASGLYSLMQNSTGGSNSALGVFALQSNTTGSNNTAVGRSADVLSNNLTNATAIGYNAKVGSSNSLVLGGTGFDAVKVGIGTTTPTQTLDVVGTAKVTGFNMPTDAAAGKILTSDATGVGTWQTAPTGSQWTTSGSDIYYNLGKVGVGTTLPSDLFHVSKTSTYELLFDEYSADAGRATLNLRKARGTPASPSTTLVGDYLGMIDFSGFGTSAFSVGAEIQSQVEQVGTNNYSNLQFYTRDPISASMTPRLWIAAGGNVGIGTTTPTQKLDVAGTINMGGFSLSTGAGVGKVLTSDASGVGSWQSLASSQWTTSGSNIHFNSGNVGIGTATPTSKLDVVSGNVGITSGDLIFPSSGTSHITATNASGYLGLGAGGNMNQLYIRPNGNIGIGTTDANTKLDVSGIINSSATTGYTLGITGALPNGVGALYHTDGATTGNLLLGANLGGLRFGVEGSGSAMAIAKTSGNVGIGTTSPSSKLEVAGTIKMSGFNLSTGASNGYVLTSDATGVGTWQLAPTGSQWTNSGSNIYFNSGNVGIGTTSPGSKLDVAITGDLTNNVAGVFRSTDPTLDKATSIEVRRAGPASSTQSAFFGTEYNSTSANSILYLSNDNNAARHFVIGRTGNVGIGTSSPSSKLDVAGTIKMSGFNLSTGASNGYVLTSDATGIGTWQLAPTGSQWTTSGSNIYFNSGNVGIGTTAPAQLLHLFTSSGATEPMIESGNARAGLQLKGGQVGDANWVLYSGYPSAGDFAIRESGIASHVVVKKTSGYVGIGTTTPAQQLSVAGTIESMSGGYKFPDGTTQTTAATTSAPPFSDATAIVKNNADPTKLVRIDASGATTGTTTTINASQTANRAITLPDASTTLVGTDVAQALTNKTLTSPVISTITNTGTLTLPTTTDMLVGRATTDLLTNKTITGTTNTVAASQLRTSTTDVVVSAATAPSAGQVLTATSGTAATWQTPASSQWTTLGSDIYYSTGKVGIGSSAAPTQALDVDGNIEIPATTATKGIVYQGSSLFMHSYGSNNFFAGVGAGNLTLTGSSNTAVGRSALNANTTGSNNTASGSNALIANTAGTANTATGSDALRTNTGGYSNTAAGAAALYLNSTGYLNVATGYSALYSNTIGYNNTATGSEALRANTTGSNNTATGYQTLVNNSTGEGNTASGYYSLKSNSGGGRNTAYGYRSMEGNTSGNYNSAIGYYALPNNTTGFENTAIGVEALQKITTGQQNAALGHESGSYVSGGVNPNQTSSYSVYLGTLTKALADGDQNEIVIGYNATGLGSNSVVLGNDAITKTGLKGSVGIGTTTPQGALDVVSTTGGFIVPRMTTAQRTALTAVKGMIVYDTDLDSFYKFGGAGAGAWTAF